MRRRQPVEASRTAARSGTSPTMKKTTLIDRYVYVLTANTSHMSGDLKFGQRCRWLAYGKRKYINHVRPRCRIGKRPAVMTAKTVIASAAR
jgi:hypothetical protein